MRFGRIASLMPVVLGLAWSSSCTERPRSQPLRPGLLLRQRAVEAQPLSPADQPGQLGYDAVGVDLMRRPGEGESEEGPRVEGISDVVRESVRPPEQAVQTTAPATAPGVSSGQYMTVGGVLAEVNGTPVFADKVLKVLEPLLAAKARELDEAQFKAAAADAVNRQVREFVRAELEFAAAQNRLESRDKQLADHLTMQWRARQVTEAGGSVELARQRAQSRGEDFEELVQQQHRLIMTQIYYEKKVRPRIQVSADDIRRFYDANRDKLFTEHERAQFRLIKIEPAKMGGREAAEEKIQDLRRRALAGEDFTELASSINHDPALMRSGGRVGEEGWVDRGALALRKVDDALWSIGVDELTEAIEEGGAFYLAKLENRRKGRVMPFEEESVQEKIRAALRAEQFGALRQAVQQNLENNAFIRWDPQMLNTAVEMAMQNYPRWTGAAPQ